MMRRYLLAASFLVMCTLMLSCGGNRQVMKENNVINVYPDQTIRKDLSLPIGINLNYLRDSNENRKGARPIQDALKDMGGKYIRYPGGEKSDWLIWPGVDGSFELPRITGYYELESLGRHVLGFDEYMSYVRDIGGIPYVVVGYDSYERTGITMEQYLSSAVEWVRYANIIKKYNITYWEIGNENWHNNTGSPQHLAEVVSIFAQEMKKIDPSIKVGASGNSLEWWRDFLPQAADFIDFLTVSQYSCTDWHGYNYYSEHRDVSLIEQAEIAAKAIEEYAPEHAGKLKVVIAELNSADFGENAWKMDNTLGHAVVTFEIIGQMLKNSDIAFGMLWSTRWMRDDESSEIWYALDANNDLLPPSKVLGIWRNHLKDQLTEISRLDGVVTFCSKSSDNGDLSVFLVNKSLTPQSVSLAIKTGSYKACEMYQLSGKGPDDTAPSWIGPHPIEIRKMKINDLVLPGVSITVLNIKAGV